MANHYTQFAVDITVTKEEYNWLAQQTNIQLISALVEEKNGNSYESDELREQGINLPFLEDMVLLDTYDNLDGDDLGFDIYPDMANNEGNDADIKPYIFSFYAEDHGNPNSLTVLLQEFIKKFRPTDSIGFVWASTCTRMNPGAFFGGAVFISAHTVKQLSSTSWLKDQMQKHEDRKKVW